MSDARVSPDPDDSIRYFLDDLTYHGKTERTRDAYERVLRRFESFLDAETRPAEATHRDCLSFVHSLRSDVAESTVATYAAYLHRFYGYMTEVGAFDENPMTLVVTEMDETVDKDPARREVSVSAMRSFVDGIRHPPLPRAGRDAF